MVFICSEGEVFKWVVQQLKKWKGLCRLCYDIKKCKNEMCPHPDYLKNGCPIWFTESRCVWCGI